MMLKLIQTKKFTKDLKRIYKRNFDLKKLNDVITKLQKQEKLPDEYKEHNLTGEYSGFKECHVQSDWLFIYKIEKDTLLLVAVRTGTHSDLF